MVSSVSPWEAAKHVLAALQAFQSLRDHARHKRLLRSAYLFFSTATLQKAFHGWTAGAAVLKAKRLALNLADLNWQQAAQRSAFVSWRTSAAHSSLLRQKVRIEIPTQS